VHEIIQIALVPLDSNIEPRRDVLPLEILITPRHPERVQHGAFVATKGLLDRAIHHGVDPEDAKSILTEWKENKLGLTYTPSGIQKKIIPLGHNYVSFDKQFIGKWLGDEWYEDLFHYECRDTFITRQFIVDWCEMNCEDQTFNRSSLGSMCAKAGVTQLMKHDALSDALATANLYRKLLASPILM
jgi:hypothetical protein